MIQPDGMGSQREGIHRTHSTLSGFSDSVATSHAPNEVPRAGGSSSSSSSPRPKLKNDDLPALLDPRASSHDHITTMSTAHGGTNSTATAPCDPQHVGHQQHSHCSM